MDWIKLVRSEYDKLNQQQESLQSKIWHENRTLVGNHLHVANTSSCVWKVDYKDPSQLSRGRRIFITTKDDPAQPAQHMRTHILPFVTPPPPVISWVPIRRNITTKDVDKLPYVPYLGDEAIDDGFIDELVDLYDNDCPENEEVEEIMDDEIFVKLVQALIPYQNNNHVSPSSDIEELENSNASTDIPEAIIFRSIKRCFRSKVNVDYLREKYMKLIKSTMKTCTPNIDDEPMTEALKRDEALVSYRKFFCRRCYIYNCQLHCNDDDNVKLNLERRIRWLKPEKPCNRTCYLIKAKSATTLKRKSEIGEAIAENEWTNSELTLLAAMITVFPDYYCAIAEAMRTKTCQQIEKQVQLSDIKPIIQKFTQRKVEPRTYRTHVFETPYKPCDHEGDCYKNENCPCVNCEKFCNCDVTCKKRYTTCSCKYSAVGSCKTRNCNCYSAKNECDPDTCTCTSCKNQVIQKRLGKKLYVATSEIHGWGVFIHESCEKNEFVTEYIGEIISQNEIERRGKVYTRINWTTAFQLNSDYVIDAKDYGNNVRFINFSNNPNCYAKVLRVNCDHRIGIFATRLIEPGEELTLDYKTYNPKN